LVPAASAPAGILRLVPPEVETVPPSGPITDAAGVSLGADEIGPCAGSGVQHKMTNATTTTPEDQSERMAREPNALRVADASHNVPRQ
jgi:hypothetical protein